MSNMKPVFNSGEGRPITKRIKVNGIENKHNEMLTRHKKRKLRKRKSR